MKLVIIDDDCLVSGALKTILEASGEVTVAATGTDGTDAVRLYREHLPDILLMDIRMKQMDGLQATVEIRKEFSDANILLLTTFSDDEYIVKALRSGARGYLLKQDYTNLLPALKAVASGQTVFGCEVVSKLPGLFRKKEAFGSWRSSPSSPTAGATRRSRRTYSSVRVRCETISAIFWIS